MGNESDYRDLTRRFIDLYVRVVQRPLEPAEFDADDLYAFQAFDRAQNCGHEELRDLAASLQAQRQARMEGVAATTAKLSSTFKMKQLSQAPAEPDASVVAAMAAAMAAKAAITDNHQTMMGPAPDAAALALAEELDFSTNLAASAPEASTAAPAERRAGAARLDPPVLKALLGMQRLYREQFGRTLDMAEFMLNDYYGRAVIEEACASGNHELAELAGRYLGPSGGPLRHRRFGPRQSAGGPGNMEIRTLSLTCDCTTQILGDFRGIATFCLVINPESSTPVTVGIKGIKPTLLAPGCAIVCRTSVVRVKGLEGATIELRFAGLRELAAEPGGNQKQ